MQIGNLSVFHDLARTENFAWAAQTGKLTLSAVGRQITLSERHFATSGGAGKAGNLCFAAVQTAGSLSGFVGLIARFPDGQARVRRQGRHKFPVGPFLRESSKSAPGVPWPIPG